MCALARCSRCRQQYPEELVDEHETRCDGAPRAWRGDCPVCGGSYPAGSFLDHLAECPGGGA